jgi:uncharacterized protein
MAVNVQLAPNEQAAIDRLKEVLTRDFSLAKLILYGSKSRGDSDRESDIDLLVILALRPDWRTKRRIYRLCFEVGLEHDVLLQPVIFSESDYASARFRITPLLQNVAAEGVEV